MQTSSRIQSLPLPHRPLRVAIVSDATAGRNGVGAYYEDLAAHLESRARVTLIAPRSRSGPWNGRLALWMPGDRTQRLWLPPVRRIALALEAFAPDTVVVPTPGPYGLLGVRLARRLEARLVIGFHTHIERLVDLYWNPWFSRLGQQALEACNRRLFRQGEVVLANSREMVAVARRLGAKEADLMGTPVALPFLQRPVTPPASPLTRVLFAGRLAREKNLGAVLTAARELPHLQFSIAGDGPLRGEVLEAVERLPNLGWLGWLDREGMLEAMDDHDLLALPSHVESFGTVALEAMARERSVLVSHHCGILDWPQLERGLFTLRQGETLAAALTRITALDPTLRRQKARWAREGALQLNHWNLERWLTVLEGR